MLPPRDAPLLRRGLVRLPFEHVERRGPAEFRHRWQLEDLGRLVAFEALNGAQLALHRTRAHAGLLDRVRSRVQLLLHLVEHVAELPELERLPGCAGVKVFMGSSTGSLLVADDEGVEAILSAISRRAAFHSEDEFRLEERKPLRVEGDGFGRSRELEANLQVAVRGLDLRPLAGYLAPAGIHPGAASLPPPVRGGIGTVCRSPSTPYTPVVSMVLHTATRVESGDHVNPHP